MIIGKKSPVCASLFPAILLLPSLLVAEEKLSFNRDVRPILSNHCFACHGFDGQKRQADLRLDTPQGAFAKREGVSIIKEGDPDQSLVWQRIVATEEDLRMPPPHAHKDLSEEQRKVIYRWISEGAEYEPHWSFIPLHSSPGSFGRLTSSLSSGQQNPIDVFLEQALEKRGLTPQPIADSKTLLRRLSFALTGLPPTLDELQRFGQSTENYLSAVDYYLASPHYGEEMARHWLDVARYADTHGLHLDNERQMWLYRDWVVSAFQENLPFDQFTIWQLAGDLLDQPTAAQRIATGFNRCNVTTSEGGAIDDEYRFLYAVDRTSTMVETWMGLTGGCAVCHDHKFDPLTMKEFYSLYAFFNNAADPPMDGNIASTEPFLKVPNPSDQNQIAAAVATENQRLTELRAFAEQVNYADPARDSSAADKKIEVIDILLDDAFPYGATTRNTSRNPSVWDAAPPGGSPSGSRSLMQKSAYFHEDVFEFTTTKYVVPENGVISFWVCPDAKDPPKVLAISLNQGGEKLAHWGEPSVEDYGFSKGTKMYYGGPMPSSGKWTELTITADDLGIKAGQELKGVSFKESGGIVWWDRLIVRGMVDPSKDPQESFRIWWSDARGKSLAELPADLRETLKEGPPNEKQLADADSGKAKQEVKTNRLRGFYLAHVARPHDPELAKLRCEWESARARRETLEQQQIGSLVFQDLSKPRPSFVMVRGQYNQPGEEVKPMTPAVLPPLVVEGREPNRLDLARWLVSQDHPLTARVTVNRFWQQLMGTGLVKTSHDFGAQGDPPSHPELLDWLALNFRESGWDVKRLIRLIVTSQAFQRQGKGTPEDFQRDPENRWLARGPRIRLDAEQIRDNALFVSGLLGLKFGGRGTMPYQPPNIWEPVGYENSNTRYYLQEHGEALYRRSLYTFLKRTAPPPFMSNFDAPNREQFCTRRERSNTPLQALQLLNDVQHFEAARGLAERILDPQQPLKDDRQRLNRAFAIVLCRQADSQELTWLEGFLQRQRVHYANDPDAARRVVNSGESIPLRFATDVETAAWTLVANLILNLDETITRN